MTATANDRIEAEAALRGMPLTSGEPATEDEIAAVLADLEEVRFDPGRAGMTARHFFQKRRDAARKAAKEAERAAIVADLAAIAEAAGTTTEAILAARAEKRTEEAEAERARQLQVARTLVRGEANAAEPQQAAQSSEAAEDESAEPMLPGTLRWQQIEETYRRLASGPTAWRKRRRIPAEPSRPEMASELHVSTATLKRACNAAGKGTRWPPKGL